MSFKSKPVAIIDSGIGGISVLKQLINKYGGGNYIYFADNLNLPYGNKNKLFLSKRVDEIIKLLKSKYNVDKILLACNTASTSIDISKYQDVYILEHDKNRVYLATELTKSNLPEHNIISTTKLPKLIEQHILNKCLILKIIRHYTNKFQLYKYKEIILGCTHFELVEQYFKLSAPKTYFKCNSKNLVNKIKLKSFNDNLNIVLLMSKYSISFYNKFFKILNEN